MKGRPKKFTQKVSKKLETQSKFARKLNYKILLKTNKNLSIRELTKLVRVNSLKMKGLLASKTNKDKTVSSIDSCYENDEINLSDQNNEATSSNNFNRINTSIDNSKRKIEINNIDDELSVNTSNEQISQSDSDGESSFELNLKDRTINISRIKKNNQQVKNKTTEEFENSKESNSPSSKKVLKGKSNRKKKRHENHERNSSEDDFVPYAGVTKLRKQSLQKVLNLRKLPDYERIAKVLNEEETTTQKRKRCLNTIKSRQGTSIYWNKYGNLMKEIEKCFINKDWNNLTQLLIHLTSGPKQCEPFLLKATILNLLINQRAEDSGLLEGFLQESFSCRTEDDINNLLTKLFHIKQKDK